MTSLSSVSQDHIARLNKEMLDLERDKSRLLRGSFQAIEDRRRHKVYYAYLLKKQDLLVKHNHAQREELYNAVMSGDATRIGKAEVKIVASDSKAHEVQLQIPTRLKGFAEAIKREQDYEEAIRHIRHKMILKSEEIHKYRPCEVFLCDHCRSKKEKSLRKQEKRRYKDGVEGAADEEKQFQGMMRRIVRKVRKLSF